MLHELRDTTLAREFFGIFCFVTKKQNEPVNRADGIVSALIASNKSMSTLNEVNLETKWLRSNDLVAMDTGRNSIKDRRNPMRNISINLSQRNDNPSTTLVLRGTKYRENEHEAIKGTVSVQTEDRSNALCESLNAGTDDSATVTASNCAKLRRRHSAFPLPHCRQSAAANLLTPGGLSATVHGNRSVSRRTSAKSARKKKSASTTSSTNSHRNATRAEDLIHSSFGIKLSPRDSRNHKVEYLTDKFLSGKKYLVGKSLNELKPVPYNQQMALDDEIINSVKTTRPSLDGYYSTLSYLDTCHDQSDNFFRTSQSPMCDSALTKSSSIGFPSGKIFRSKHHYFHQLALAEKMQSGYYREMS